MDRAFLEACKVTILTSWTLGHIQVMPDLSRDSFDWAWFTVNTRAVYLDTDPRSGLAFHKLKLDGGGVCKNGTRWSFRTDLPRSISQYMDLPQSMVDMLIYIFLFS